MMWDDYEPGKYTPPPNAFYSHVKIPIPEHHPRAVRKLLGNRGGFLKHVTQRTHVEYIWYNKDALVIEIWAYNEASLRNAHRWISRAVDRLKPDFCKVFANAQLEHAVLNDDHEKNDHHQDDHERVHDRCCDERKVREDDDQHAHRGDQGASE